MENAHSSENASLIQDSSPQNVTEISKEQVIPRSYLNCCSYKDDLTTLEYSNFQLLKQKCLIPYDNDNETHKEELNKLFTNFKSLYTGLFPNEDDSSFSYKTIGFQTTNNPQTDFRNGGFISLQFMNHYLTQNEMKDIMQLKYFSFACVCINIVNELKIFLRLISDDEIQQCETQGNILCNRTHVKHFAIALCENDIIFYEIVAEILRYVVKEFKTNYNEEKREQNYLLITGFIKKGISNINDVLLKNNNVNDILINLRKK